MRIASTMLVPLLAVFVAWTLSPTAVRAEMFSYRDDRGILHFSNVRDDSRWVPLAVPSSVKARVLDARNQAYPFSVIVSVQALLHGIDAALVRAIIKVESDFDPQALSRKGAMGLMQLLPETAQRYGRVDLYEPDANIRVGVQHLKRLMAQFRNDLRLTLAAYNAGAEAVAKHGGIPPFPETIEYIGRVLRHYQSYRVSTDALSERNAADSGKGKRGQEP